MRSTSAMTLGSVRPTVPPLVRCTDCPLPGGTNSFHHPERLIPNEEG